MSALDIISGKNVLVTGASGFIGTKLISLLDGREAQIHGVSRNVREARSDNIQWHKGDLADVKWVDPLLKEVRPDIIYHLAGMVTGSQSLDTVIPMFQNTLQTTVNLLKSAVENGCGRFIMAGSMTEETDNDRTPGSPYAAAKIASSYYTRMFHSLYGLPIVNTRIFMTYGPGQMDLVKIIPYVIISLLQGKAPRLSNGSRLVDWVFVDDVAKGLLSLAGSKNIVGGSVDFGSGHLTSIQEVVEKIVTLTGSNLDPDFGALQNRLLEPVVSARTEETFKKIGWAPEVSLNQGLEETVEWFRDQLDKGMIRP